MTRGVAFGAPSFNAGQAMMFPAIPWHRRSLHRLDGVAPSFFLGARYGKHVVRGRSASFASVVSTQNNSTIRTYFDKDGVLQTASANTPRITYERGYPQGLFEGAATNFARNSGNAGAVVGVIGAGGSRPNWTIINTTYAGLTFEVTAVGNTNGIAWTEFRISGTNNSSASAYPDFRPSEFPAATLGQTWTFSAYASLQSGAWPVGGTTAGAINIGEYNSANSYLLSSKSSVISVWKRYSVSRTFSSANVATANGFIGLAIGVGETVDFTFRIGGLQLEKSPSATSLIQTNGTVLTRTADLATLHSSAGDMTAWAWRGYIPARARDWLPLLTGSGGVYFSGDNSSPAKVGLFGHTNEGGTIATPAVIPGDVNFCGGWGASGRRLAVAGGEVNAGVDVPNRSRTTMFIGSNNGLGPGQAIYLDELVGWVLPDRPSAAGVQSQARAAA